jgi:hypothetical protein
VGIYPQSVVGGEKPYEQRTEYMEGWNDAVTETSRRVEAVLDSLRAECDESDLAYLIGTGSFHYNGERLLLNLNDTFHYACADCEVVPPEEYAELKRLMVRYGQCGDTYWAATKRGYDPEIPRYCKWVEAVRALEESAR